jgi:hypothetical protein
MTSSSSKSSKGVDNSGGLSDTMEIGDCTRLPLDRLGGIALSALETQFFDGEHEQLTAKSEASHFSDFNDSIDSSGALPLKVDRPASEAPSLLIKIESQ